jgi:hypothetical protein
MAAYTQNPPMICMPPRVAPCHSDCSRPGVGDEMLNSYRKPVQIICWSGNKDKIARRMTPAQVRIGSDVSTRLGASVHVYRNGGSFGKTVPSLRSRITG